MHTPGEQQIIYGLGEQLLRPASTAVNVLRHRERDQPMHHSPQNVNGRIQVSHPDSLCLAPLLDGRPNGQKQRFGFLDLVQGSL